MWATLEGFLNRGGEQTGLRADERGGGVSWTGDKRVVRETRGGPTGWGWGLLSFPLPLREGWPRPMGSREQPGAFQWGEGRSSASGDRG